MAGRKEIVYFLCSRIEQHMLMNRHIGLYLSQKKFQIKNMKTWIPDPLLPPNIIITLDKSLQASVFSSGK